TVPNIAKNINHSLSPVPHKIFS
ncbi:uncharacterized protein METZ01_LOCUS276030, partial [marine metagenome]